ncbi:NAD(P)/FAD-dependent oxidoreductase [Chloroflexota bacterium]
MTKDNTMIDITIIGAGVIGLAIAAQVSNKSKQVYVLENNKTFGQETSSRNSQVIHAGLYYPQGTLKAKTCVEGNALLYQLCREHNIGHKRLGKLVVAVDDNETEELEALLEKGEKNGLKGLKILDRQATKKLEPNVRAVAALLVPSTGIVDAHALMRYFVGKAIDNGTKMVYKTKVVGIEKRKSGFRVSVEDQSGGSSFMTRLLINCAGLNSDKIAHLAGIDISKEGYNLHYCKGEYFKLTGGKSKLVKRLIYPVPKARGAGLGIHTAPTLNGTMLIGPNARYTDTIDYSVDEGQRAVFYDSIVGFLPFVNCDDLEPEMTGIRPKLQGPRDDFRDFIIRDERDKGLPGFINLVGIESPGLTASPAIARYVKAIADGALREGDY